MLGNGYCSPGVPLRLEVSAASKSTGGADGTGTSNPTKQDAISFSPKFFVRHGGYLNVHIDAVEQRAAHFSEVALNNTGSATAFTRAIARRIRTEAGSQNADCGLELVLDPVFP